MNEETKITLEGLGNFKGFSKVWNLIKINSKASLSPKCPLGSRVSVYNGQNLNLVVVDVCHYNNTDIYLLANQFNNVLQLITQEDCISTME